MLPFKILGWVLQWFLIIGIFAMSMAQNTIKQAEIRQDKKRRLKKKKLV